MRDWLVADPGSCDGVASQVVDVQQQSRLLGVSAAQLHAPLQQTVLSHLEGQESGRQKLRVIGHRVAGIAQCVEQLDHFSRKGILVADVPGSVRALHVPVDCKVLVDPNPGLVKVIEEDEPGIGREVSKLLV